MRLIGPQDLLTKKQHSREELNRGNVFQYSAQKIHKKVKIQLFLSSLIHIGGLEV
jgi:hypothetical protein